MEIKNNVYVFTDELTDAREMWVILKCNLGTHATD